MDGSWMVHGSWSMDQGSLASWHRPLVPFNVPRGTLHLEQWAVVSGRSLHYTDCMKL